MPDWLLSIICGAVAGAVASELRERYKEWRTIKLQRKALVLAFQVKIKSDLEVLQNSSSLTEYLGSDEKAYYLTVSPLWELKQIEVFQYAPDLASSLSNYFTKLNMLLSKMSYKPDTSFPMSTYSDDDIQIVVGAGNTALIAIKQFV